MGRGRKLIPSFGSRVQSLRTISHCQGFDLLLLRIRTSFILATQRARFCDWQAACATLFRGGKLLSDGEPSVQRECTTSPLVMQLIGSRYRLRMSRYRTTKVIFVQCVQITMYMYGQWLAGAGEGVVGCGRVVWLGVGVWLGVERVQRHKLPGPSSGSAWSGLLCRTD